MAGVILPVQPVCLGQFESTKKTVPIKIASQQRPDFFRQLIIPFLSCTWTGL